MAKNKENMSTEETLDMLAAMAEEELKARENDNKSKPAKKKNKAKEPAKEPEPEKKTEPQVPKKKKKKKSAQQKAASEAKTDYEENPFTAFAERMSEAGRALEKREEKPEYDEPAEYEDDEPEEMPRETRKEIKREVGRSRRLGGPDRTVGEEITRERAEQIISKGKTNKELGGRRATIIVRRTVVDTSGNLVKGADPDIYRGGTEDETYEQEPPMEKPVRKAPALLLIREDTGEAFPLDEDLTIGREEDNDICIPEPEGHYVSGHHAEIQIKGKDIYLKDIGSTNGTFVNGSRISSKRVRAGQTIKFADIVFSVEED